MINFNVVYKANDCGIKKYSAYNTNSILHLMTAVFHEIHDKYRANQGTSNDGRYQGTNTHELGAHGNGTRV